jgi:hypothetical protein
MQHVIIKDNDLNGWEYGMLRSFEKAIVKETNATTVNIPKYSFDRNYLKHFGHGMKRGVYRRYFPRQAFDIEADVAWYILMGPENYRLDLYKNWERGGKKKILYLYDTLPSQYAAIKRLFSNNHWDVLITSFNDAVADLEKITGRKWHCIEQAADIDLFKPVPVSERTIHFSSYGRRHLPLHEALIEFCAVNNLYYDYTTHDGKHPTADSSELYKQYAWHLAHSMFTFSWPVELTNPQRAGHLRPVTCRWFEAAAAGTVIAGQAPDNAAFSKYLSNDIVVKLDYNSSRSEYLKSLDTLFKNYDKYHNRAFQLSQQLMPSISWKDRVKRIIDL